MSVYTMDVIYAMVHSPIVLNANTAKYCMAKKRFKTSANLKKGKNVIIEMY